LDPILVALLERGCDDQKNRSPGEGHEGLLAGG